METTLNSRLLPQHRADLARSPGLWQLELLSCGGLAKRASELGLSGFNEDSIRSLWDAGLLRADLVVSDSPVTPPSLPAIDSDVGEYTYVDDRRASKWPNGMSGAIKTPSELDKAPRPMFHPFRLFVLYHIDRVFTFRTTPAQYLYRSSGYESLVKWHVESLDRFTANDIAAERFSYWNEVAEAAIVLEPGAFEEVYGYTRLPGLADATAYQTRLEERRELAKSLVAEIGRGALDEIRRNLCYEADTFDGNNDLHVILRFMRGQERLKLKGRLGAAMLLLGMSETIRRASERQFGPLSEEDELRPGQWMQGARKMIYGTDRVADASSLDRRDFLVLKGLDYATKVRCYVEGDTEMGALEHALGRFQAIELVNLQGRVVERGKREIAFVESLERDLQNRVFSIILLDSDRTDNVRAVRKAAGEDRFFGRFFLSAPDIEYGNFTKHELIEVADRLAQEEGLEVERTAIVEAVASASDGSSFIQGLKDCGLDRVLGKGARWGESLMRYAIECPNVGQGHALSGKTRKILEAAELAIRGIGVAFRFSFDRFRVDADTGELVEREVAKDHLELPPTSSPLSGR